MRTKLIFLTATLAAMFILISTASAQKVGGYKQSSKTDAGARAAAEFAVDAQAERKNLTIELVAVEKAETQVVAGTNFRLCLKITTSGADFYTTTNYIYETNILLINISFNLKVYQQA